MMLIYRNIFIAALTLLLSVTLSAQQPAKKIDEIGQIKDSEICVRLDILAVQLKENPNDKAYIIFYGGRKYLRYFNDQKKQSFTAKEIPAQRREAEIRLRGWDRYLTFFKDIEKTRVEIINGGYREKFTVEFWLAPEGAKPPELSPTLTEKDIKFRKSRPKDVSFKQPNC